MKEFLKDKKKKMIAILAASLVLIGGVTGITISVIKAQTQVVENKFSIGKVTIEIEEIIDETKMQKEPSVKNTGSCDCLIRMKVAINPSDAKIKLTGGAFAEVNQTKWVYNEKDGFYYYQDIVPAGESTEALFTNYEWTGKEDYSDFEEFDIVLYQEAIQVEAVSDDEKVSFKDNTYDADTAEKLWNIYDVNQNE